LARIIALYGGQMNEKGEILKTPDVARLKKDMFATSISDSETRETLKKVYERHKVILEPHGAVGFAGLQQYYKNNTVGEENQLSVSLETAHPAKFPQEINEILGFDPELPPSLRNLENKEEQMVKLPVSYEKFKQYLKNKY